MDTFSERFWDHVRDHEAMLQFFLVADLLFVVLALAAYPLVESGSAAHVLVVLDLLVFFALFVPLTYLLYHCRRRRLEEEEL